MATNEKGLLGGFSGKVGTVAGGSWNGIDYMRGNPTHISNPRTVAQQDQRARMSAMIKFLSPLKDFLRLGFKSKAVKMSAFNAATSYNLAHAVIGNFPDYEIDYSKLMVSQGKLPGAVNPQIISTASGQIKFTWDDNSSDRDASPDDRAILLVYNPQKESTVTSFGESFRASGSQTIDLPGSMEGEELVCYISFRNVRQTVISDSGFAGAMMM
jgi:hypothetical protein